MRPASNRVFDDYKRKVMPAMVGVAVLGLPLAMALSAWLIPLLGPVAPGLAVVAYFWWFFERGILFGNQRLRQRVAGKLLGFGRRVEQAGDRFVGLAWPCHFETAERRLVETDDDVGFLRVTPAGIEFFGDGIEFTVAADQIAAVRLKRHGQAMAFWNRVEVDIRDGEPMETVVFDSRDKPGHTACRRDNQRLYRELRALVGPDVEQVRLEARALEEEFERLDA